MWQWRLNVLPACLPSVQLWRECENSLRVLSMSQQTEVEIDSLYEGYDLR